MIFLKNRFFLRNMAFTLHRLNLLKFIDEPLFFTCICSNSHFCWHCCSVCLSSLILLQVELKSNMEEKPKMKNTAEEAPSRISTSIMSEKQATARSGLRTSNNQSSQSLVMQLQQQAAQISTITGGVSSSSPGKWFFKY